MRSASARASLTGTTSSRSPWTSSSGAEIVVARS
jgi:hypothetical protein